MNPYKIGDWKINKLVLLNEEILLVYKTNFMFTNKAQQIIPVLKAVKSFAILNIIFCNILQMWKNFLSM